MKISIPDKIVECTGFPQKEMLEFVAVCLYKARRINGVQGGRILGLSVVEFHRLLKKYNECVNYGIKIAVVAQESGLGKKHSIQ